MTALIEVEGSLAWFPTRIPYGTVVVDIEIASTIVHGYVIITITGDTAELRVLIEGVAAGGVRDQ
jgi:hypothetical protein